MQWGPGENAGFTAGKPWLRLGPDHQRLNVETERQDPSSLLNLYRDVLRLRRELEPLRLGSFRPLSAHPGLVWCYARERHGQSALVCLNFGRAGEAADLGSAPGKWRVRYSSASPARAGEVAERRLHLEGCEAAILVPA